MEKTAINSITSYEVFMLNNIIENSKQSNNIFFKKIGDAALSKSEHIVTSLLPNGKREGDEWVALNPKRADTSLGSFKTNLRTGVWSDFATGDKGGDLIGLVAHVKGVKQGEAAKILQADFGINSTAFSGTNQRTEENWEPIIPAPLDAFKPKTENQYWGIPVAEYIYTNENGEPITCIYRYEKDGVKKFLAMTYGRLNGSAPRWEWKAPKGNIPLYRLQQLAKNPNKPVLIFEGEKKANKAAEIFGEAYCYVSSAFGAKSAHKTNWTHLKDRDVIIWPDNDQEGHNYAQNVAELVMRTSTKSVRIIQIPKNFPEKWDIADPLSDSYTSDIYNTLLQTAASFVLQSSITEKIGNDIVYAGDFRITTRGIEKWIKSKRGAEDDAQSSGHYAFVSANVDVVGRVKALDGSGWGLYLNWKDDDNEKHDWILPFGDFQKRESNSFLEHLANNGLAIARGKGKYLSEYLESKRFSELKKLISIAMIGWTPDLDAFVLPDAIYGSNKYIFCGNKEHPFKKNGSLQLWCDSVAKYAVGNSRLTFVLSMAFLPPLLKILGHNGFGVNLYGDSKTGKTTLQHIAGSVWGGKKYFDTWRVTANGLEGRAAEHNDTFKGMDEIHLIDPNALDEASYFLSEGAGKTRAQQSGDVKKTKVWDMIYLSTGEKSSAQRLAEGNITQKAGQKMRLIDIQVRPKDGYGVYESLHEFTSVSEISKRLKDNCEKTYGEAIRAFLNMLLQSDKHAIKEKCENFLKDFMDTMNKYERSMFEMDDQVKHVARCCALIGFAGALSTEWNILPWHKDSAKNAAIKLFHDWANDQNNVTKSFEENEIIDHLSTQLQLYSSSYFPDYDNSARDEFYSEIWGYTKTYGGIKISKVEGGTATFTEGGHKLFYVSNKAFENVLFKKYNKKHVLNILEKRGVLIPYENAKTGKKEPSHSLQPRDVKMRFYVLNVQNLFDESDGDTPKPNKD